MNIDNNPVLRERLAAEYVLGTLKGGARRRFERWLQTDALLRATVTQWQRHFSGFAELPRAVTPPARVWTGIERRLGMSREAPWWQFWRGAGARVWGGLAVAAGALAVTMAVMLKIQVQPPALEQVATLTDDQARTALVVAADARRGRLEVRVAEGIQVPSDRTLQLWAITKAGKPRSLGILPDNRSASLALDERAVGADVMLLAISLEPKGGSPDPTGPTGPVLYKGSWVRL
ncbi:anti-sigma factor [Massilia sp. DD77]|uniref:anti-sigma factor n=1 Tax=Massilia sp. DD77 TaxID=3109349 RepID=UPI002FFF4A17